VQLCNPDLGGKLALGQGLLSVTRKTMSPTTTSQGFSPATACQVSQRRQMGNAKIVFPPFEPASSRKFRRLGMEGLVEDGLLYGRHLLVWVLEMAKSATCTCDSTGAQNLEIIGTDCLRCCDQKLFA